MFLVTKGHPISRRTSELCSRLSLCFSFLSDQYAPPDSARSFRVRRFVAELVSLDNCWVTSHFPSLTARFLQQVSSLFPRNLAPEPLPMGQRPSAASISAAVDAPSVPFSSSASVCSCIWAARRRLPVASHHRYGTFSTLPPASSPPRESYF